MLAKKLISSKTTSLVALVAALTLSFSFVTSALAAPLTGFGTPPNCTLAGWNASGMVSAVDSAAVGFGRGCLGKVAVDLRLPTPASLTDVTSTLSQTFTVPAKPNNMDSLKFEIWAFSENGITPTQGDTLEEPVIPDYFPQIITIYDAKGQVVYRASHNLNSYARFDFPVAAYAGQDLKLEVKVQISKTATGAPFWATLYISTPYIDAVQEGPGDGTYSW
jgi:hypothetical protein